MASNKQATEVNEDARDIHEYEFAFHILPTVAGTEVADIVNELTTLVTRGGGEVFDTESPQRIELAYEIGKVTDGVRKYYHSAYFGWIRIRMSTEGLNVLNDELRTVPSLLRYIIVKIGKEEIENPFCYHEKPRNNARKAENESEDDVEGKEVSDSPVGDESSSSDEQKETVLQSVA